MSRRGLALFALLSVLWGVPYLLIKVAVAEVSVPFLVFARSALGAAILLPFAFAFSGSGSGFATVKTHWRPVLAFALVEMVIPWGLIVHRDRVRLLLRPDSRGRLGARRGHHVCGARRAVASGVALLGEPLDARIIAAFALTLCGSWLATARVSQRLEASGPTPGH